MLHSIQYLLSNIRPVFYLLYEGTHRQSDVCVFFTFYIVWSNLTQSQIIKLWNETWLSYSILKALKILSNDDEVPTFLFAEPHWLVVQCQTRLLICFDWFCPSQGLHKMCIHFHKMGSVNLINPYFVCFHISTGLEFSPNKLSCLAFSKWNALCCANVVKMGCSTLKLHHSRCYGLQRIMQPCPPTI